MGILYETRIYRERSRWSRERGGRERGEKEREGEREIHVYDVCTSYLASKITARDVHAGNNKSESGRGLFYVILEE